MKNQIKKKKENLILSKNDKLNLINKYFNDDT